MGQGKRLGVCLPLDGMSESTGTSATGTRAWRWKLLVGSGGVWPFFGVAGSSAVGGSWLGCFAFQERSMAFGGVRQYNGIGVTPLTIFG